MCFLICKIVVKDNTCIFLKSLLLQRDGLVASILKTAKYDINIIITFVTYPAPPYQPVEVHVEQWIDLAELSVHVVLLGDLQTDGRQSRGGGNGLNQ